MGAGAIATLLRAHGVELTERAVRYHLEQLDAEGCTEPRGRAGRRITELGRKEVAQAHVADKVRLVFARLEALAYQMEFDVETGRGTIVVNISHVPSSEARRALAVMRPVLASRFCSSRRIALLKPGDRLGNHVVPRGMVGLATVCSVTINGILMTHGVPVHSAFGGLLAIEGHEPTRFVDLVHYGATSLDPLEIFIKGGATSVTQAVSRGSGVVGAGFREFPAVARDQVAALVDRAERWKIGGVLAIGGPSRPLTEVPVDLGRCGMVVCAGLNAIAAIEEARIVTASRAMETIVAYDQLTDIDDVRWPR
jgi:repressor of nif and glnA expression